MQDKVFKWIKLSLIISQSIWLRAEGIQHPDFLGSNSGNVFFLVGDLEQVT
jgi:hypothetical protein